MEIKVTLLDNQKLQAEFNGFKIQSDQPENNKGENTAPSPFDYFLTSTALCAGYFVKAYCQPRNLPTDQIEIIQKNSKDPENKYKQIVEFVVRVPKDFSEKDRMGIVRSVEGCSVKKTIQEIPEFKIEIA